MRQVLKNKLMDSKEILSKLVSKETICNVGLKVVEKATNFLADGLEVANNALAQVVLNSEPQKIQPKQQQKQQQKQEEEIGKPPECVFKPGIPFGYINARKVYFDPDKIRHITEVGATGMGKTEFLLHQVMERTGVCFCDNADGEAADRIVKALPEERLKKLIILDHSEKTLPIPIGFSKNGTTNVFEEDAIVGQWVNFFETNFGLDEQYATQELISYSCKAVFSLKEGNLLDVVRMTKDQQFRTWVLNQVSDQDVREWWNRFEENSTSAQAQITASFLRRAGILFRDKFLKYTLGVKPQRLEYRKWMDEGYTVIIKVKESLGKLPVKVIMSLHVLGFWEAALSRDNIPQAQRKPFLLIADEPQTWLSKNEDVLDDLFSKARKYRLFLLTAFQSFEQIAKESPSLLKVLRSNVPDYITYRTDEAQIKKNGHKMEKIPEYHFLAEINGSKPFLVKSLGKLGEVRENTESIHKQSRDRFNRDYREIETEIQRREQFWQQGAAGTPGSHTMSNISGSGLSPELRNGIDPSSHSSIVIR